MVLLGFTFFTATMFAGGKLGVAFSFGEMMADFFYRYRGQYPRLANARLPAFNWAGLAAYAVGTVAAFSSPWVAPLVGIAAAALTYVLLTGMLGARTANAPLQDL
jgi:cytosine permease